jgi:tetratricopeptide (TPR) repeat protein
VCALALLLVPACGGHRDDALAKARASMQEFQRQLDQLTSSQSANEPTAAAAAEKAIITALQNARDQFRAGGVEASNDPKLLMEYADVLSRLGDVDLLRNTLERLVRIEPGSAVAWIGLGRSRAMAGPDHATAAAEAFRRALELKPEPKIAAGAYDGLAELYAANGTYDLARENLNKALEISPESAGVKISLVALEIRQANVKAASDLLKTFGNAALPPDASRKLHKALADFRENRRTFPDTAENHLAYAELLIRGDRLPDSVMPIQRAVVLAPDNYVAWNMLGSIRMAVNDLPGARAAFQQSLQVKPDQPRTQQSIAEIDRALTQAPAAPQPGGMQ